MTTKKKKSSSLVREEEEGIWGCKEEHSSMDLLFAKRDEVSYFNSPQSICMCSGPVTGQGEVPDGDLNSCSCWSWSERDSKALLTGEEKYLAQWHN